MRRVIILVAAAAAAALPEAAGADGLPVGNVDVGPQGVVVPGAPDRIVTLPAGGGATLVGRIARDGGSVERTLLLDEPFTVPGVALDGTADGRSADGRTAVLIRPRGNRRFPLRRTRFLILSVRPLEVRRRVTLRGDFSFDALSPDGRRMYVVHYVHRRDPRRYVVRSFDVRRGRLEPGAIVDARDPGEDMRGYPITRTTAPGGRWAYTLYDGDGEPFVHALDTAERRAFCIDLPMLAAPATLDEPRLRWAPGGLSVVTGDEVKAIIDTETMHAREPIEAAAAGSVARRASGASGPDWALTGALGALMIAGLAGLGRLAGRRGPNG